MKGFLLDTRVFLQFLDGVMPVLKDKEPVLYVSAASFFEIAVKKALKKVRVPDNLDEIAVASGLRILPIMPDHALRTVRLPYHHTDPYDRLLIAQAKIEGLCLVTSNAVFQKYDSSTILV
ncbi:MAG: type II toxin-antitoxin system VapC family toxin [Proteobacteria bacterium]|nr:type II toxin-antitoxin system VapC family toxin [Pseudomonadota bacterium]